MVYSSSGGKIPHANISVQGIDHVIHTSEDGDYWRILVPGTYNITASAHGFESVTQTVTVLANDAGLPKETTLDFTLMPDDSPHW